MRIYNVIMDVETEDKIFGGWLTLRQLLYVGTNFVYFFVTFYLHTVFTPIVLIIKLSIGLVIAVTTIVFAFVKKDIYYLDYYLIKKYRFRKNNKPSIYRKF